MSRRRRLPRFSVTRDGILFIAGLAGIANETIAQGGERPTLLLLFGAMCGLPAFLRQDEKKKPEPPAVHAEAQPAPEDAP